MYYISRTNNIDFLKGTFYKLGLVLIKNKRKERSIWNVIIQNIETILNKFIFLNSDIFYPKFNSKRDQNSCTHLISWKRNDYSKSFGASRLW